MVSLITWRVAEVLLSFPWEHVVFAAPVSILSERVPPALTSRPPHVQLRPSIWHISALLCPDPAATTHSARVYLLEAAEDKALYCDFFLSRGRSRAPANPLMGKEYLSLYRFTLSLAMCMTLATLVASLRLFPHLCVCLR